MWGHSSAGRALAWHARGRRFDPAWLHQFLRFGSSDFCDFWPASPSSRGLGHIPFTDATGVRIPVGTPILNVGLKRRAVAYGLFGRTLRVHARRKVHHLPLLRRRSSGTAGACDKSLRSSRHALCRVATVNYPSRRVVLGLAGRIPSWVGRLAKPLQQARRLGVDAAGIGASTPRRHRELPDTMGESTNLFSRASAARSLSFRRSRRRRRDKSYRLLFDPCGDSLNDSIRKARRQPRLHRRDMRVGRFN